MPRLLRPDSPDWSGLKIEMLDFSQAMQTETHRRIVRRASGAVRSGLLDRVAFANEGWMVTAPNHNIATRTIIHVMSAALERERILREVQPVQDMFKAQSLILLASTRLNQEQLEVLVPQVGFVTSQALEQQGYPFRLPNPQGR